MNQLIYDVGLHKGEDSEFYLAKGFDVVGVEAHPDLCDLASARLASYVVSGRLRIVNVAVSDSAGPLRFYCSTKSDWGTAVREWSDQNAERGFLSEAITVNAVTLAELIHQFGDPYYVKIDIEGMDRAALASLHQLERQPKYLSIESAFPRDPSFRNARAEFDALAALGYDHFKIVSQQHVEDQVPPEPPLEGNYVPFRFSPGSSGLFGDEAPGEWLPLSDALKQFRTLMRRGWPETALFKMRRLHKAYLSAKWHLAHRGEVVAWYDIHAKRPSAHEEKCP